MSQRAGTLERVGRELTNDFSWSKSRHEKFSECLRAYYLYYYRSWGGWAEDAPEEVRSLYVLKKLHNRWTWAGGVVHGTIRDALVRVRHGRAVDAAFFIEQAHRLMREDYRHSMGKGYWQRKLRREFAGLVEHEYGEPIPPDEWKRNWENVKAALEWFFFQSSWLETARKLRPEQWLEVDEADFEKTVFTLEGVRVFAVPDFAYLDEQGAPVVVDWKTGKPQDGYDAQVLGYALYLGQRYQLDASQVRARLVYLNAGKEQEVTVDPTALERFRSHFGQSVSRMRELLEDAAANRPLPEEKFPMTESRETCARCVFRRVCGRDAPALANVG